MRGLSFLVFFSFTSFGFASGKVTSHYQTGALASTLDVCANVNINVLTALGLLDLTNSGQLHVCLCASTVVPYIQANALLQDVANIVGVDAVADLLLNVIAAHGQDCTYPAHAIPFCESNNPCDFGCGDGYTRVGQNCVCQAPQIECHGMCQSQACSSALPRKRSADIAGLRSRMRILTDERCPHGHRLCGAGGSRRRGEDDWECIDTRRTLDSCGGCMYHYALDDHPMEGIDCTSLPGVSGVECQAGRCHVHRCKRGWIIGPSASGCIPLYMSHVAPAT